MHLSIIIVHWNAWDALADCLISLDRAVCRWPGRPEVIVIDNASAENHWDSIGAESATCTLIRNQNNLGFARACNQGIQRSSGSLLLFLNPDTEVLPGALEDLTGLLERQPQVGAAGPLLLNRDGSVQQSVFPEPGLGSEFVRLFHLDGWVRQPTGRPGGLAGEGGLDAELLSGACLLVRRVVLDEVGWFDPQFYMYTEDYDLCRRIRGAGWRLAWVPTARIVHLGGQSSRLVPSDMFVELYRSKFRYFRKHHGWLRAWGYKLLLLLVSVSRQPLALVPGRRARELRKTALFYRLLMARLASL